MAFSLFQKQLSSADLAERIHNFSAGTAELEAKQTKLRRRLSGALAREAGGEAAGSDTRKLRQELAALNDELAARPEALAALEREHRRASRLEQVAALRKSGAEARTWAERMAKRAERLHTLLAQLAVEVNTWISDAPPPGAGPAGDLTGRIPWQGALALGGLENGLGDLVGGKGANAAQAALRYCADTLARQAAQFLEQKASSLEGDERRDAEVAFEMPDAEPAAAAGRAV